MSSWDLSNGAWWVGKPVVRVIGDALPRIHIVASGRILSSRMLTVGRSRSLLATLDDRSGQIGLFFLGRPVVAGVLPGVHCSVESTVSQSREGLVVMNPLYRLETCDHHHDWSSKAVDDRSQ